MKSATLAMPMPRLTGTGLADGASLVAVLGVIYAGKSLYSTAGVDQLGWVLAPTAALVELFTGASFPYEAGYGYMSEALRFAIVPACAGINFMLVAFATLATVLALNQKRAGLRVVGFGLAALLAYAATIVINAGRIAIAVHLRGVEVLGLDADHIHRVEGVAVYVLALLGLFELGRALRRSLDAERLGVMVPLAWYAAITLLIPALGGAIGSAEFQQHAAWTALIAGAIAVLVYGGRALWRDSLRRGRSW